MKSQMIEEIQIQMRPILNQSQMIQLSKTLKNVFGNYELVNISQDKDLDNEKLLKAFLSAKKLEGCSPRTIKSYGATVRKMLKVVDKNIENITTEDIRDYLFNYKTLSNPSKTTIDNIRLVLSSFFSWLENEDYILKNPVKRIHKIRKGKIVKEVISDENIELLRDSCDNIRDLAMFELLLSTGIRVGELVNLNIEDINFSEREAIVFGKGGSQRVVYFDARTKIHLKKYLDSRQDDNKALFVHFRKPHNRLGIRGVETRVRSLGLKCKIDKIHPHKFRRTLATRAIDKGMPIEQVQKLLGHQKIDTTMHYAMVDQSNVKNSHRIFVG